MRPAILILLGAVLVFPSGQRPSGIPYCDREPALRDRGTGLCQDNVHQPVLVDIEDRTRLQRLADEAATLVQRGRTTDMEILIKQLSLDRCQLDLPETAAPVNEPVELYAKTRGSVVVVGGLQECGKCEKLHASTASGFFVSDSGAVVTNYHVVNDPKKETLVVMTADDHVYPVERVLAASRADDLAILKIAADGPPVSPLALANEPARVGSTVSVISHPAGHFYCFTSGVVSRSMKIRSGDLKIDALSITADFARGSSGAPVLNNSGQVVAVAKSTQCVYHAVEDGRPVKLQMVLKTCIPVQSLLKLIDG